jgi:ubiquinone/menaquinone biosynthesis C-methylase UbiE
MVAPYFCPKDKGPLRETAAAFVCGTCAASYPITNGLAQLDIVHSKEAELFDQMYASYDRMNDAELAQTKNIAQRFMTVVGKNTALDKKLSGGAAIDVIDVACGRGELTIGLLACEQLRRARIFAFDHSQGSLAALDRTARTHGLRERLFLSQQDITALAFAPGAFDLVLGNAVLHHFLDWKGFLARVSRLLTAEGIAVFAEPFVDGYFIATHVFQLAARELRMSPDDLKMPAMGQFGFITNDISFRIKNDGNLAAMATLFDKHLFSIDGLARAGHELGFRVGFHQYEPAEYYGFYLDDILRTYQITHPEFVRVARQFYGDIRAFVGDQFPNLFAHFRFIELSRA